MWEAPTNPGPAAVKAALCFTPHSPVTGLFTFAFLLLGSSKALKVLLSHGVGLFQEHVIQKDNRLAYQLIHGCLR